MIFDIEFFYKGEWHFHNQEVDRTQAVNWATWIRSRLDVPSRIVLRGEGVVEVYP